MNILNNKKNKYFILLRILCLEEYIKKMSVISEKNAIMNLLKYRDEEKKLLSDLSVYLEN